MRGLSSAVGIGAMVALAGGASAQLIGYGVTANNRIVSFDTMNPGSILSDNAITGLNPGEAIRGLDFRPLTRQFFIITSDSRVMQLDAGGTASAIGSGFTPALDPLAAGFGVDFNPTVDRIRVVDANGGNRRLNPLTGGAVAPALDTALTYNDGSGLTPRAVGAAYTGSMFGMLTPVGTVKQYIIDSGRDVLGEVGSMAAGNPSFNGGVVTPIGALGFDLGDSAGFDIFGPTGQAFISDTTGVSSKLYTLNLNTGATVLVGEIGSGLYLTDIAVIPAPGAAGMLAMAGAMAARRRRR
jgi:hypothetical protein